MVEGLLQWLLTVFAQRHPVTMLIAISVMTLDSLAELAKVCEQGAKVVVAMCAAVAAVCKTVAILRKALKAWRK